MSIPFIKFLESMTIATEADDITQTTTNEIRSVLGDDISTISEPSNDEDNEDLMKVDDIFGTNKPEDGPSGDPEDDTTSGSEEIPQMDDSEVGEDTPFSEDENNPAEDDNDAPNEDLVFTSKNRVRDNMVQLYSIVTGNIEIIVNSLTNINDEKTIQVMNAVLNHLRNCKDYIYKTLTQNLNSLSYDELLQRYITLKRVYDICAKMMETHFEISSKR